MKPATEIPAKLLATLQTCVDDHGMKDASRRVRLSRERVRMTLRDGAGGSKVLTRLTAYAESLRPKK